MKPKSILRSFLLAVGSSLLAVSYSHAASLTWDISAAAGVTGGTGAWNTSNTNWTTDGGATNISWTNVVGTPKDDAIFGGATGTVTLGEAISLRNLSFTNLAGPYIITGSTLNFTGGTISTVAQTAGGNPVIAEIRSNITGAPAINIQPMDGDEVFALNPSAGNTMAIGAVTGDGGNGSERLSLQGGAGSSGTIASSTGPKVLVSGGSWTLNGASTGRNHEVSAGTLTLNANLNATHRAVILSGTGVLNYNVASAVSATVATNTSTDNGFRITGGTLDQTRVAGAINTNASTTHIDLAGTLTFAGTNGANSNLHLGSGVVWLKDGNRQITVTNAATTLTIGGVIQNDDVSGRSLTKAGAGTLALSGASANTYNGTTTVNGGVLALNKTAGVNAIAGAITLGDGATTAGNDILRLDANNQIADTTVITFNAATGGNAGIFRLNNQSETVAGIASTGGGGIIENESGSAATSTLTVNNSATQSFSGIIRNGDGVGTDGTLALIKSGGGTLTLSGPNTYTGGTTISAGTLALGANNVLADTSAISIGAATLNAATFTDTAGTLDVTNTAAVINLGSGGALAFADSSAVDWTDILGNLDITGTFVSGSSIRFGTTSGGLTSGQLAVISVNGSGAGTYSLDASGYLVVGGTPSVTLGGTLAAVDTTYGTASPTPTSFTVSGANLTGAPGNLTVTPPSGFEVSLTIGSGYTTSLSVPYATSTLSATDVYLRLAATTNFGTYSGNIEVTGGGLGGPETIATVSSNVAKKALSVTAPIIANKPYDTFVTAGAVTVGDLSGFVGSETVTATATAADYSSADVGTYPGTVVTYSLADGDNGGLASNYSLADGSATGEIVKADQTITFTLTSPVNRSAGTVSLSATASSGLSVTTFGSSNSAIASVSGSTLTLHQGGSINVTADQVGDSNYNPAPQASQPLIITGYTAVADAATRPTNSPNIKIPIATLLANDGAVGGDGNVTPGTGLTLTGVTSGTGNSVTSDATWVYYTPDNPADSDPLTFTYTSSDGTDSATATVTVSTVNSEPFTLDILRVVTAAAYDSMEDETSVTIEFAGVPNQDYLIEYSTDLDNWSTPEEFPTGVTGTFNATFTAPGDVAAEWDSLFFRANRE